MSFSRFLFPVQVPAESTMRPRLFRTADLFLRGGVALYFSLVLYFSLFPDIHAALIPLFFLAFFCLLTVACRFLPDPLLPLRKPQNHVFLYSGIAVLLTLLIQGGMFLCCYGSYTPDTVCQWNQATTGEFNDWAPALHTMMIWLLMKIWAEYSFVVAVQLICFALATGYLTLTLLRSGFPAWIVLSSVLFIQFHPQTLMFLQHPIKDCAFAIAILICACHMIRICVTDGEWLRLKKNVVTFGCFLVLASLLRHNGIFFTVPCVLLAVLCFHSKLQKAVFLLPAVFVLVFFVVRGPVYKLAGVRSATSYPATHVFVESCPLPFGMMAEVWLKHPENVPPEADAFLKSILPRQVWAERFDHFSFDSVKWLPENLERDIMRMSPADFTSVFLRTVQVDPASATLFFIRNTGVGWRPVVRDENERFVPSFGRPVRETKALNMVKRHWFNRTQFSRSLWFSLFWSLGLWMLPFCFLCVVRFVHDSYRVLILVLPAAAYNLGTMFMMTSYDDVRYFYFNVLTMIPLMLVMIAGLKNETPDFTEKVPEFEVKQ